MSTESLSNSNEVSLDTLTNDTRKAKAELRSEIRSKLKLISQKEVEEQSLLTWSHIINLPAYKEAKTVGLFLSMPKGEINTDQLLVNILSDKEKTLFVPRVGINFEKCDMELVQVVDANKSYENNIENPDGKNKKMFYDEWTRNKWRIPEPPMTKEDLVAKPGDLDVLLVPGVAFDKHGGRLGHGKGYYDRFIERMRSIHSGDENQNLFMKPYLIGVGLSPQLLDADEQGKDILVPKLGHDFQMDHLVFPHCSLELVSMSKYEKKKT